MKRVNQLFNCIILILLLGGFQSAYGFAVVSEVANGAQGRCLPELPSEIASNQMAYLNENEVTVEGDLMRNPEIVESLTRVVYSLNQLGARTFDRHRGVIFNFTDDTGASNYDGTRINMRASNQALRGLGCLNEPALMAASFEPHNHPHGAHCHHGANGHNNISRLLHEAAHYIGHRPAPAPRRGTMYDAYTAAMSGGVCAVSGYASSDSARSTDKNEEFAEAFSAYVSNPELLTDEKGCAPAREFFKTVFGEDQVPRSCEQRLAMAGGEEASGTNNIFGFPMRRSSDPAIFDSREI